MASLHHLPCPSCAAGQEGTCPSATDREWAKFLGLVYWTFDPWILCFLWKCHTGCVCAEQYWEIGLGEELEGSRPVWPGQAPCAMPREALSAQCHSSHRSQLESPQKPVCSQRSLPSCVESEGWKVLPDGMHSSAKLQHRKKYLPLPSWWFFIWHIQISLREGTFCSCTHWSVTSLHCLADRSILFFLTKTFLLQFKSITSCPNHNRQKVDIILLWSTEVFFILDIYWHIFSLKFSSIQFSNLNLLSLLSVTCSPDLIILCIKSFWLIHTCLKAWQHNGKQQSSRGFAEAERSRKKA